MENQIKIRVKAVAMHGKSVKLPGAGLTVINKKGIIKVSAEVAQLLLTNRNDYELYEKEKVEDVKTEEDDTEEDDQTGGDAEDEEDEDDEEDSEDEDEEDEDVNPLTKENLEKLEIDEIVQILKDSEIDATKYEKFLTKKGLLINFVLKTLK